MVVWYPSCCLNKRPSVDQTVFNHLNTVLVHYSDPHCKFYFSPTPAQRSLPPSSSSELGLELVQFETHRLIEERSQHDRRKSENVET